MQLDDFVQLRPFALDHLGLLQGVVEMRNGKYGKVMICKLNAGYLHINGYVKGE